MGEGEDGVRNNLPNRDNEVPKVLKEDLKTEEQESDEVSWL